MLRPLCRRLRRLALDYVDEDGATTRTSFDEVAEQSRRFANVLQSDGLARGDRVAVFLSQSLELPIAHLAAFRSGMISIPLFALFGETRWNSACRIRKPRQSSPTRAAGRSWQNPRSSPALKNVYVIGGRGARRDETVLVFPEGGIAGFCHVDLDGDPP